MVDCILVLEVEKFVFEVWVVLFGLRVLLGLILDVFKNDFSIVQFCFDLVEVFCFRGVVEIRFCIVDDEFIKFCEKIKNDFRVLRRLEFECVSLIIRLRD